MLTLATSPGDPSHSEPAAVGGDHVPGGVHPDAPDQLRGVNIGRERYLLLRLERREPLGKGRANRVVSRAPER
jgi:hypothetical protein